MRDRTNNAAETIRPKCEDRNTQGVNDFEEEIEEDPYGEEEARVPVALRDPGQPTAQEIIEHNLTHVPYRSWCPDCVRGRGSHLSHKKQGIDKDDAIPTISFDYAFLGGDEDFEKDETKLMPVLVAKDSRSKYVFSSVVPKKGGHPWVVSLVVWWFDYLGYKRVILKSDGENAIRDVLKQVNECWHGDAALEGPPTGDSKANGAAERAVRSVTGQTRTLKLALERRLRQEIPGNAAILTWIVRHAGVVVSRHEMKVDGKTAYERLRGKQSKRRMAEFGKKVLFKM
jgi:hypothetical protein